MKQIIKFIPFVAASFVIASCSNGTAHKVTLSSVNGEWRGATQAYEGVNYSATFTPNNGYELKGSNLYVRVNNNRLAENKDYTFYDNHLTILSGAITGDVTVTANASAIEYSIINNIENATIGTDKAYHNQALNLTVKARDFFILPDEIKVYVNDQELKSGFTYTPSENLLTINAECVTGTITLSGVSVEMMEVVFNSGNGGSWTTETGLVTTKYAYVKKGATFADAKKQISSNPGANANSDEFDCWLHNEEPIADDVKIEEYDFTVDARYRKIVLNVTGGSSSYYSFDWKGMLRDNGTVPYGDTYNLTIDFLAHPEPPTPSNTNDAHTIDCSGMTHCITQYKEDSYEEGAKVAFIIVPEYGYALPTKDKITVEGVTTYDYVISTSKYATFTCTMPGNDITIKGEATPTEDVLYKMPEAITITATDRKSRVTTTLVSPTDYTIERTDKQIELTINPSGTIGDLNIVVNPYYEAEVVFNPGEGQWVGGGTEPKTVTIEAGGPDTVKFNLLEALRIKAKAVEPVKEGYAFIGWKDTKTGEMVEDNGIVSNSMNLEAVYGGIDFENDSWANVIANANKGLDSLVSTYRLGNAGNLKGATRNIVTGNDTIGYYMQKAVVIGWDHDTISGAKNDERATLTFMFQKVFAKSIFDEEPAGGEPRLAHNAWKGSYLQISTVSTLSTYVPDIMSGLVPVEKTTYNAGTRGYDITDETFFPFSQNELNITSSSGSDVKIEGAPYEYFKQGGSLERESVLVDDSSYWLRSAYLKDESNNYVHYVDEDGNVKNDVYSKSHGIFVGFCLGQVQG